MINVRLQMLGTQRSGSNMVRLILGGVQGFIAPPSAHELRDFHDLFDSYCPLSEQTLHELIRDICELVRLNALPWPQTACSPSSIRQHINGTSLAHVIIALYDYVASSTGNSGWLCKCLENFEYYDELVASGAGIQFLHLIRDPRDVALSFARAPIGPKDPVVIALKWKQDQQAILACRQRFGAGWHELRYEDVLSSPDEQFRVLCSRLDLPWDSSALQFHRTAEAQTAAPLSTLWTNLAKPIDKSRVAAHMDPANAKFVEAVEDVLADDLREFGYRPLYKHQSRQPTVQELEAAIDRDRQLRAALATKRLPDQEELHRRRERFLQALGHRRASQTDGNQ